MPFFVVCQGIFFYSGFMLQGLYLVTSNVKIVLDLFDLSATLVVCKVTMLVAFVCTYEKSFKLILLFVLTFYFDKMAG